MQSKEFDDPIGFTPPKAPKFFIAQYIFLCMATASFTLDGMFIGVINIKITTANAKPYKSDMATDTVK